jgi:hypothetical protein
MDLAVSVRDGGDPRSAVWGLGARVSRAHGQAAGAGRYSVTWVWQGRDVPPCDIAIEGKGKPFAVEIGLAPKTTKRLRAILLGLSDPVYSRIQISCGSAALVIRIRGLAARLKVQPSTLPDAARWLWPIPGAPLPKNSAAGLAPRRNIIRPRASVQRRSCRSRVRAPRVQLGLTEGEVAPRVRGSTLRPDAIADRDVVPAR